MTPTRPGAATRMTIYRGSDDRFHHKALFPTIVYRARERSPVGAGAYVHTDRLLDPADNLPAMIIIVDADVRYVGGGAPTP